MNSISESKRKWRWAAVAQLAVIAHTVLFAVYVVEDQLQYAATVLGVIVLLSYYAIQLAWQAGVYWPTGDRES
jgi:hypothetical protein